MDKSNYFNNPEQSNYYEFGYNWRMSSITAALGISQLSKLDKLIQMRKDNANYLSSRLQKHSKLISQSCTIYSTVWNIIWR